MANLSPHVPLTIFFIFLLVLESSAKLSEVNVDAATPGIAVSTPEVKVPETKAKTPEIKAKVPEIKVPKKSTDGAALLFADELKQTLERYLFGICPQTFKIQLRNKNSTFSCDLDTEQQDLAGRFATLALRAHTAARSDCIRFGAALANTLGELARTAASRSAVNVAASNEANKKRKLSKSQKMKIQAKQRTALAVKKKAAALAAAAAAKTTSS